MPHITERTTERKPAVTTFKGGEIEYFLDEAAPHWVAVDGRGAGLLSELDGRSSFGEIVASYARNSGLEAGKAWLHVHDFLQDGLRGGFLAFEPLERPPFEGRLQYARPQSLREP